MFDIWHLVERIALFLQHIGIFHTSDKDASYFVAVDHQAAVVGQYQRIAPRNVDGTLLTLGEVLRQELVPLFGDDLSIGIDIE
ncbi:hypothetical protein D1872_257950 [compost metagenome]